MARRGDREPTYPYSSAKMLSVLPHDDGRVRPGNVFMEAVHRLERVDDGVAGRNLHPQRGAQLVHRRGGFDAVADDVAHDKDQSIPEGYRVKPVAAGRGVLRGDEVLRGDVGPGTTGTVGASNACCMMVAESRTLRYRSDSCSMCA
jgi:hypothetical protein